LELGTSAGDQKYRAEKEVWNNFRLRDRRMDRHTDNGHGTTARPRLRI